MEQKSLPDIKEQADNDEYEKRFLASLNSGTVSLEFPRWPYDEHRDPDIEATLDYLEEYTRDNPEHTFMVFESMSLGTGYMFPHLVKLDLPDNQPPEAIRDYVADFIFESFKQGSGLQWEIGTLPGRRSYYHVIHEGVIYLGTDDRQYGPIEFLGNQLFGYSDYSKTLSTQTME